MLKILIEEKYKVKSSKVVYEYGKFMVMHGEKENLENIQLVLVSCLAQSGTYPK